MPSQMVTRDGHVLRRIDRRASFPAVYLGGFLVLLICASGLAVDKDALRAAFQEKSYFVGTWRNDKGIGEIAIAFEKSSGVKIRATLYDPEDFDRRREVEGTLDDEKGDEPAVLEIKGKGSGRGKAASQTAEMFLRDSASFRMGLTPTADGLKGTASKGVALSLRKVSERDFRDLEKKSRDAAGSRVDAIVDAFSPGRKYTGTWESKKERAEIGFVFTHISPAKIDVQGYFYHPAQPQYKREFSGKLFTDVTDEWQLRAVSPYEARITAAASGLPTLLVSDYKTEIFLNVTRSGIEGRVKSTSAKTNNSTFRLQ